MTTTYLRSFTHCDLLCAQDLAKAARSQTGDTVLAALTTPVNGEALAMPIVCTGWEARRAALGVKAGSVKGEADRAAYMQGAIAALAACGLLTTERINQITWLAAVGRLDTYMAAQAAKDVEVAA